MYNNFPNTSGFEIIIIIIIELNSLLFMCSVNSCKANYRHSTGYIEVITLWSNTTQSQGKLQESTGENTY
jgi:hypothetical protein